MTARVSELIRGWLGWCPAGHPAAVRGRADPFVSYAEGIRSRNPGAPGAGIPSGRRELRYEHEQPGYVILGAIGGAAAILLLAILLAGPHPVTIGVLCLMLFILLIMSRLSVSVDEEQIRIRFGPVGLVRREWPLRSIAGVSVVTNPWYYGYGIRFTPCGILYNVSGRAAAEILFTDGHRVRIGTDEPEALAAAIARAIR